MAKRNAQMILDKHWDRKLPVDILKIANELGLSVRYLTGNAELLYSGEYKQDDGSGRPVCYINRNDTVERQRFTLAHEVAHHVLAHGPALRDTDRSMHSYDPKEREANIFAANLLMPDKAVKSMIDSGITDAVRLADIFAVSVPALKIKMKELGYL